MIPLTLQNGQFSPDKHLTPPPATTRRLCDERPLSHPPGRRGLSPSASPRRPLTSGTSFSTPPTRGSHLAQPRWLTGKLTTQSYRPLMSGQQPSKLNSMRSARNSGSD
ncbi:Hypothetical predicted protein [Pelobates cultripes]|uniref:Uncharacterized protein n=1 Tax=Pelobates cultripes TaxID=61616 RepID=A0AAD1S1V8_PELCU|nr:Hypothetical predicted protein [Pelobates cultripes]